MNNLKVAGVLLVVAGILLPLVGMDIPTPIDTLFKVDETATSTSYLFFPFINWLSVIGVVVFAIGYVQAWRKGK